jgi:hypothetical protein
MSNLEEVFQERLDDIQAYLDFLESLEAELRNQIPKTGKGEAFFTPRQQKMLYSSVYLQLYNLIESTINKCVESISNAIINESTNPKDLSNEIRKQWVRFVAKTDEPLEPTKRLNEADKLCLYLIQSQVITDFTISKGAKGAKTILEVEDIRKLIRRLGVNDVISQEATKGVEDKVFLNRVGAFKLITTLRNDLAHGSKSFVEAGESVAVSDLRNLTVRTERFLREVVRCFDEYVGNRQYLRSQQNPPEVVS